jgi:hypothetical protein
MSNYAWSNIFTTLVARIVSRITSPTNTNEADISIDFFGGITNLSSSNNKFSDFETTSAFVSTGTFTPTPSLTLILVSLVSHVLFSPPTDTSIMIGDSCIPLNTSSSCITSILSPKQSIFTPLGSFTTSLDIDLRPNNNKQRRRMQASNISVTPSPLPSGDSIPVQTAPASSGAILFIHTAGLDLSVTSSSLSLSVFYKSYYVHLSSNIYKRNG